MFERRRRDCREWRERKVEERMRRRKRRRWLEGREAEKVKNLEQVCSRCNPEGFD